MTHKINIILNGGSPRIDIEAEINMDTRAFEFTSIPTITDTKFIEKLNTLGKAIQDIHLTIGEIEKLEVDKIP